MDLCFCFFYFTFVSCSILFLFFFLPCSVKSGSNRDIASKRRYCFRAGNMNLVQNFMERLRSLVGLKSWDYCVLWKLSEDQRFIEWMDCCCSGAENNQNGGEELHFPVSPVLPCRDVLSQHTRTKSCDLLSQLPSSMPLDSGIHAQALLSNQPRWINFSNSSDSSFMEETIGTRVLIPVPGGLVELFVAKQVSEDQDVIDFITAQCSISMEQEAMINSSNMDTNFSVVHGLQSKPYLGDANDQKDPNNHFHPPISPATALENLNLPYDISVDQIRLCNSPMNFLQQFNFTSENRANNDIFFEGSNDSYLSDKLMNPFKDNGFQDMDALQKSMMTNTANMHLHLVEKEQQGNDKDSVKQETGRSDSISDCSDQIDDEDDPKYRRRNGKGPQSKNLVAERKRRKKLNDRLYALRALVPKISKLDRASILGDAIEFVKELQKQAKELQDELEDHSDDEGAKNAGINGNHNNLPSEILNQNGVLNLGPKPDHARTPNGFHTGASGNDVANPLKQNHESEITNDKAQQMEPQVEVAQIDGNEFFVKVFCEHKRGGFVRLLEALNSLGLEVTNANVTSFRSLVSNVFKVEVISFNTSPFKRAYDLKLAIFSPFALWQKRDSEMVQADHVRDSLLELTRNPSGGWPETSKASENGSGMDYHHHHHHHHLHNHHMNSYQHHLHHLHN
ncbi:hypothetical protein L1049_015648 [Liquidambar formosana]|uniref:BHLH domain-containing protein n=1 Tax=Liquidambar formosana TaxID=63359 RepID=A0AAP0RXX6_LIQFO